MSLKRIGYVQGEPLSSDKISDDCHNLLWKRRLQLTQSTYFQTASKGACDGELARIDECRNIPEHSGSKIPCLFDHKSEVSWSSLKRLSPKQVTNQACYEYLKFVGEIILSDYRLVYNFIKQCESDIERFKCGRVSVNKPEEEKVSVASQGDTINCLTHRIEKLTQSCAHQIFRISELQSDDFHLDRPLFYACREDREQLCPNVLAGKGRVMDCLMKNKFDEGMSKECQEHLTKR